MTGLAGKDRNIWLVWLGWPILTLGVYTFVWYYKVNREAREFDERIEVDPFLSVMAILVGWLIIVPPFVSMYRTGTRIARMQRAAGLDVTCNGWIGMVLWFFAGLSALYYQYELNRVWASYATPEPGTPVPIKA